MNWLRKNCFSSLSASLLSLFLIAMLLWFIPPFIDWTFIKATWQGSSKADCKSGGACWAMINARWDLFIYGFYPIDERWRVNLSLGLLQRYYNITTLWCGAFG
jgi:general L-amino acid transport system permease protein